MSAYWVQIINDQEVIGNRHVRFPFKTAAGALAFNEALIGLFKKHHVDSVMGSYRDGELCPCGHTS